MTDEQEAIALVAESVARQHPIDERHASSCKELAALLGLVEHPFDRAAGPRHVTSSGIVLSHRGVLFHRHRRLHRWLQPGGHVDCGESPAEAVLREVEEETGLVVHHLDPGPRLTHVDVHEAGGHLHFDLRYLLLGPDADPAPPPGESQEVAWLSTSEALRLSDDEGLSGLLTALRQGHDGSGPLPLSIRRLYKQRS